MSASSFARRAVPAIALAIATVPSIAPAAPRPQPPPPLYHYVWLAHGVEDVSRDGTAVGLANGDAGCPSATGGVAVIFGPLSASTSGTVAPSFVDPIGPRPERSYARAISGDGTIVAGIAAMPDDQTADACDNVDGVAVWEPCGTTWCRSWVEPPSGGGHWVSDVEWVGGIPLVIGQHDGENAVWRRIDTTWSREDLGIPAGASSSIIPFRVQGDGLVVALNSPAGAWDCSGATCEWLGQLSAAGLASPGSASGINSRGDIVGSGTPAGGSVPRALIWWFTPTMAGPAWSAPQLLPDFGFGASARASEWVDGKVTVVGQVQPKRTGGRELMTWTWNGTTWSSPVKLGDQDDSTASVGGYSHVRMSPEGDVVHQNGQWVELRLP